MIGARALWCEAAGRASLRDEAVTVAPGDVGVRMLWSGISRGTERLVAQGRVPPGQYATMRAPFQQGEFPFPVKYGYAAVGVVEQGPEALVGRTVFALHPHQSFFTVPAAAVIAVPDAVTPRRAILAANMETALNAVWDGAAAPGDRIAVVGAGALGLLTAMILSRLPGAEVTLIDVLTERGDIAAQLGVKFACVKDAPADCDLAFHTSATAAGLATAMATLGPDATLVEMSWHGAGETPVALGGAFHARRLRLQSSQVGSLPPSRRPRWDHRRRLALALALLADPRLDALITAEVDFAALPDALPAILGGGGVATAVRYG